MMIDPKGYILTNAHILKGNRAIVINSNKKEFRANVMLKIESTDLVILKINDTDYISPKSPFPINIRPIKVKLGEDVFALTNVFGKDLVFAKGYVGCTSGFNNDTNYYQIDMSAFPGNSGSPVFDKNGNIIGLLSYKQKSIESISYSLKNKQIFDIIKQLQNNQKSDSLNVLDIPPLKIQLPKNNAIRPEITKQISIFEPYIFAVKAY
ncbi:MAG: serine protease [Sediminibacterium sp.]|nr:serine protease [Sediminibacterium sp.]